MKKVFIAFILTGILFSCSNDDNSNNQMIIENIDLLNTENYEYDLGSFGDEEGASITIQAEYFEISDLKKIVNSSKIIYQYVPQEGFVGSDSVEITTNRGSDGASSGNDISTVKVKFNVTE